MAGIEITKMSLITFATAFTKREVSTVDAADPVFKYDLRIYYTSTVSGFGMVTVKIGKIVKNLGVGTIQPVSRYWEFPMTYFTHSTSATIADLLSMAGLSNQLIIEAYVSVDVYTSNTASITIPVTGVVTPPSVSITRVAVWDSVASKEVTSVNTTDSLAKYSLTVYYTSSGNGVCTLTVTVGGKTAWSGSANIQAGSGYWSVPFTSLASGTIADLMSKYGVSGNQITICADISNVRSS
jgi:hypothetical protein